MKYLFPASFILNTFAMTALLIGLSLAKQSQMAAEIGIVQGATLALFFSFSANARSMILNPSSRISVRALLVARLVLLAPLSTASLYLSVFIADVGEPLAVVLILRRCAEWIGELHLSDMELHGQRKLAGKFIVLQSVLLFLALGWTLAEAPIPLLGLFLWALLPLLMSLGFIRRHLRAAGRLNAAWPQMLPQFGSTAIIGITVYVFRLVILLIVGKETAGDLYAAFAIGGLFGSIFSSALGPSLVLQEARSGRRHFSTGLTISLYVWLLAGAILFFVSQYQFDLLDWTGKSYLFWGATGLSMIGGAIMVFAQRIRLRLLQLSEDKDVFGPDVLINILVLAAVPYFHYLGDRDALMTLYLFSSVLALLFYFSSERGFSLLGEHFSPSIATIRKLIVIFLFFPLFFQLTGNIFHDTAFVFDSEGVLKRLPLPLSVIVCYAGIFLLGGYHRAYLSLGFIFLSFVLMIVASLVSTHGLIAEQKGKLLLLFQFVLPMFALVLGQAYEAQERGSAQFERILLYVIALLVPTQILASWLQGSLLLSPSLYLFSVYQHLQYVPVIVVMCYLLVLYRLWGLSHYQKIMLWLCPLIAVYAAASSTILPTLGLLVGLVGFLIYQRRQRMDQRLLAMVMVAIMLSAGYAVLVRNSDHVIGKSVFPHLTDANLQQQLNTLMPDIASRLRCWEYYGTNVISTPKDFLFGHPDRPDRSLFPSAHNYYLDLLYNFGVIALLPVVVVLGFTLYAAYRYRYQIFASQSLLGLTGVVLFLLLVDNSLKVGLRQPYPGIITFFLWGMVLARIESLRKADKRRLAADG